jgi:uncharacterized protein with NRDE domain
MCLILLAHEVHPEYRLILAANRDEFYDRPSAPLAYWDEAPSILAGKDLKAFGTWLGITRTGRLAAITNYRNPSHQKSQAPSRGDIVKNYLVGEIAPGSYLKRLQSSAGEYNGFNLLLADYHELFYYSNISNQISPLGAGYYGLSNHLLNTPWPKVKNATHAMRQIAEKGSALDPESLFDLLSDPQIPPDEKLPDTGVGIEWERRLGAIFIRSPIYGTRCSSIVLISWDNHVRFMERTFNTTSDRAAQPVTRDVEFILKR